LGAGIKLKPRDIFLRIEPLARYSPLAPIVCSRHYGRDCMRNHGHELGRIPPQEIHGAAVDALVYREYLDPHYTIPNRAKLIPADVNEPPWERRVPGALLWANPGERLHIHVVNGDKEDCHSFHLHGLRYGIESDGAWPLGIGTKDGRRSDEIKPGERWTYVFDATEETIGAWGFHDHVRDVAAVVNRGLFGGLIVRDPSAGCPDHEVPMFVHQMVGTGIACDFLSPSLDPGDTFSFRFGTVEGVCRYHCQIHGESMAGEIRVQAGAPDPRPVSAKNNRFVPEIATVAPGGEVVWTNDETDANHNHVVVSDGGGAATFCLNGRAFVGNTPTVVADAGERLRWYLFNLDLGGVWHNFHPHSARWQLPTPPGGASDVHSLSPVETFVADTEVPPALRLPCELEDLQCDPPADACRLRLKGDFLFHCHIEDHMMRGLAGLVRSRQSVWLTDAVAKEIAVELPLDDGRNECGFVELDRCRPRRRPPKRDQHDDPHRDPHAGHGTVATSATGFPTAHDLEHAATRGVWELLPCDSQVLAVHAALLRTGKALFFAGSGNDEQYTTGLRSIVWDYENGGFYQPFTPIDLFCAGQAFLPDGRLLVVGGTKNYAFTGLDTAFVFDPTLEEWIRVGNMATGRWYPSVVALADGRALTVGAAGATVQAFSPVTGWGPLVSSPANWPLYPNLVLLASGKVFFSGASFDDAFQQPRIYDVAANTQQAVGGLNPPDGRGMGTTVLLPPAQNQRVMVLGGNGFGAAMANTSIANLSAAAPAFVNGPNMLHPRTMLNAVLLPDRTVFVTGGGSHGETVADAELRSEIYDPAANAWREAAKATVPRLYHSVALLLPDGRVITAGSNPNRRDDELRLELYHPPYLFKGPRPFIESAPVKVTWGEAFEIHTPQASEIRWAQLIRPMATTHSCETDQRLVDLPIARRHRGFCRLRVTVPRQRGVVPPGWYMLFITDRGGIPSVAHWVQVEE